MAKRRTSRATKRAARKADKLAGINKPSGKSRYALKALGQRQPKIDPHRRPSWFVREGWAALGEKAARLHVDSDGEVRLGNAA